MRSGLLLSFLVLGLFLFGCTQPYTPTATPLPTEQPTATVQPTEAPTPTGQPTVEPTLSPTTQESESVQIVSFKFSPQTITVARGTTVVWLNKDYASHTVTSDTGAFESGTMTTGRTWSYTFDTPGEYAYHCGVHPSMAGKVIVT